MKACHVITGLDTGGAETSLCRLLETLRSPEFTHAVIALGSPSTLSSRIAQVAELHHLDMRAGQLMPGDLLRLRSLIRRAQPDLVHGWMYHANLMASAAVAGLRRPLLWGIRQALYDLTREKRTTRLAIRAGAMLSFLPNRVLYNSAVSARQHESMGYAAHKSLVIPNGFDTAAFAPDDRARSLIRAELGLQQDALVIGLVARVHPMKDHANFLRAAALFAATCPQARFLLVGDGADAGNPALSDLIGELDLQDRVGLCGRRTDIAAITAALDIASSSSSWGEAFPNIIGEAMACGVPCVATDVGDVPQIIGDTGVVVPPRNAVALAAGWAQLASLDAPARRALGLRARQRITGHYSLQQVSRQYADLYTSLIGQG